MANPHQHLERLQHVDHCSGVAEADCHKSFEGTHANPCYLIDPVNELLRPDDVARPWEHPYDEAPQVCDSKEVLRNLWSKEQVDYDQGQFEQQFPGALVTFNELNDLRTRRNCNNNPDTCTIGYDDLINWLNLVSTHRQHFKSKNPVLNCSAVEDKKECTNSYRQTEGNPKYTDVCISKESAMEDALRLLGPSSRGYQNVENNLPQCASYGSYYKRIWGGKHKHYTKSELEEKQMLGERNLVHEYKEQLRCNNNFLDDNETNCKVGFDDFTYKIEEDLLKDSWN